jgi:hypothetical protein
MLPACEPVRGLLNGMAFARGSVRRTPGATKRDGKEEVSSASEARGGESCPSALSTQLEIPSESVRKHLHFREGSFIFGTSIWD